MKTRTLVRLWGILGAFALVLPCEAATVEITAPNTPYDSGSMKGNTLLITAGSSLVSNETTYPVATSCTISGSGDWIVSNAGNVYYSGNDGSDAKPKVAPAVSGFAGKIFLGSANTRWMAQNAFYSQLGSGRFDVKGQAQVWISSGTTINASFNLHDPLASGEASIGSIRFDGNGSKINGNIALETAGSDFRLCVRQDSSTTTNTINGVISGAGNLVFSSYSTEKNKPNTKSTLVLTAANTYSGTTSISEGKLELQGAGTLGAGAITINALHFTVEGIFDGTLVLNKAAGSDSALSQAISGDGFIEQKGAGATTFSGSLSGFTGTLTQTAGTVTFAGSAAASGAGSTITLAGGTMNLGTLASLGTFNYSGGTLNAGTAPTSASAVNLNGGTLEFSTLTSTFALPAGSKVSLNAGSVVTTSVSDLPNVNAVLQTNGGTVQVNSSDYVITADTTYPTSTEFTQAVTLNVPTTKSAVLTVTNAADTVKFSAGLGEPSDAAGQSLVKAGAGTLIIEKPSFTGKTTVNSGKLVFSGMFDALPTAVTSQVTVAAGAEFQTTQLYQVGTSVNFVPLVLSGAGAVCYDNFSAKNTEICSMTNSGFTGTIVVGQNDATNSIRLRIYGTLKSFDANTLSFMNGSQLHVAGNTNYACDLILSSVGLASYENRGAVRFDEVLGTNAGAVLSGDVTLAGDTLVSVWKDNSSAGWGMFSGPISGTGKLTLGSSNGTLVLTGANTHEGGTTVSRGTLQLGLSGTINSVTYDGKSGTLGSGLLTVGTDGSFAFNRADAYDFAGGVTNNGNLSVNSGTFKTSAASVTNNKTWNVAAGAAYESASDFTGTAGSAFTNAGTLSVTDGTFASGGTFTNTGTVNVASGAMLRFIAPAAFNGNTQLSVADGGTLELASSGCLLLGDGSSAARMQASGTITLTSGSQFVVNSKGTLSVGKDSDTTGQTLAFAGAGSVDLGDGTLELSVFSASDYDQINFGGLAANTENAALFLSISDSANLDPSSAYTLNWVKNAAAAPSFASIGLSANYADWVARLNSNGSITFGSSSALPEPSAWVLLLAGLGLLGCVKRNFRKC